LDELDLVSLADIQQSEYFPDSANIEFVEVIDKKHVRCRVIERGNGETLACGSGACAVVTVGFSLGILENEAFVEYRGGTLKARVDTDWTLYLSSNAYKVYEGTI
jgi:diaminopimelate epimerase